VREVTSGNTRIPWEHLGTEEECKSFLRGIFDHGGWVYTGRSGGIGFNKKGGEALLEDLCRVFARVEVFPIVVYGDVPSLKLKDQAEWRGFAERVELASAARREAVNALASRTSTRPHYSIDDYSNVIAFAKSSTLNSREVGEAMGIPTNTVRGWLVNGQQPPVVKRAQTIEGFTTTLGSPEVVNYVYRELGASSALARRCGHALDLRTAQRKSSFDQGDRARIYGDDTSLSTLLL
jgi:hypothetical protein